MSASSTTRSLLLVGPGKHFGLQLARRFATEGFAIGLLARTHANMEPIAASLRDEGHSCATAVADVGDSSTLLAALRDLVNKNGLPQCVIYNVRHESSGKGLITSPDELSAALHTNVVGAFAVIQATSSLVGARSGCTLILTGGGYKDRPLAAKLSLSVSKAALHSLFRALSPSLRQRRISLRTLIIDGAVRPSGPIFPTDVADAFWESFVARSRIVHRLPKGAEPQIDDRQQTLFVRHPQHRGVH